MTVADKIDLYRQLYRIRRVEERLAEIYPTDKIQSPMHLSIGQEIASVAVCRHLRKTDAAFGTYRGHALYLAKGGSISAFVAELFGKKTGCCGGWGGSMHLAAPEAGLIACSAIVASTIPLAVGWALANKLRGNDDLAVCFFGDGATEEGAFYEALNFAALHHLRVLFVCEDNGYAIHSPVRARQWAPMVERVAAALGTSVLDCSYGATIEAQLDYARRSVAKVRRGEPDFLRYRVARAKEHVGPGEDWSVGYRHRGDWSLALDENDAVAQARRAIHYAEAEKVEAEADREVEEAILFAESSPFPDSLEIA